MINFRYHIVSLCAVFLALALGVVLGAGPLQTRLNTALSSSSSTSSAVQDAQLAARAQAEAAGLQALASAQLDNSLSGVSIALIVLPGAANEDVDATRESLTQAGASVVGRVSLSDNWDSQSMAQYRSTLSTTLSSHLSGEGARTASADGVMGYAITQVLSTTGSETDLLRQILTDSSTPIMTVDEDPVGSARTFVAVGPREISRSQGATTPADTARSSDAWSGLAQAVGANGGVIVGEASSADAMITQIRNSGVTVTSIDSVGTVLSRVNTVLALAHPGSGVRAFGVGNGAQSILAPTE